MAGIEQSKDFLEKVGKLVDIAGEVFADGKFSLSDLPKLAPAFFDVKAMVADAKDIPAELASLTSDDSVALAQDAMDVVLKVVALFTK